MLRDLPALLPTPAVNDMGAGKDPQWWDEWAARQKTADGRPAPHGKSLEQEALRMLPTPRATRGGSATETVNLLPTPTVQQGRNMTSGRQPGAVFNTGTTLQDVIYAGLIGASMSPPSDDGSDSPGQHPSPPSQEPTASSDCLPLSSSG